MLKGNYGISKVCDVLGVDVEVQTIQTGEDIDYAMKQLQSEICQLQRALDEEKCQATELREINESLKSSLTNKSVRVKNDSEMQNKLTKLSSSLASKDKRSQAMEKHIKDLIDQVKFQGDLARKHNTDKKELASKLQIAKCSIEKMQKKMQELQNDLDCYQGNKENLRFDKRSIMI